MRIFLSLFSGCLCLALIMTASISDAEAQTSRIYLAGYMGLNTMPDNEYTESTSGQSGDYQTNNTLSFAGAIGVRLNRKLRFEGEVNYSQSEFSELKTRAGQNISSGGEISNLSLFLNGYYDFDQFKWKAKPFVTAGLGLMRFDTSIEPSSTLPDRDDQSYALGWQLGGGLKYRLKPNMAFTGAYRYIGANDFGVSTYDIDYSAHEFRVGVEYDLNWQ